MAYNNLTQIVAQVRKNLRNAIDADVLVEWSNDIQEDVYTLNIPLFEKTQLNFSTTDQTLVYTLANIASDIRQVRAVRIDLDDVGTDYQDSYVKKLEFRWKFLDFKHNELLLELEQDPDGYNIDVIYYRTPVAITDIASAIDLPLRWRRVIYLGMMAMAAEHQYKLPEGNWVVMFDKYKDRINDTEKVQNRGADTVDPYSILF